jgi:Uma2 family endonuclease
MTVETTPIEPTSSHAVQAAPRHMSYEEWLAWEHEGGLTEWVNGEVIIFMPPLDEHQRIVEFLDRLMGLFVELFNLGMVRIAPFTMRAKPGGQGREPDLFFLASAHMSRLTRKELAGPADLIVEVISEDSIARDRDDKFYEYQEAGVREYWIIDPRPGKQRVDLYVLGPDGRYQPVIATSDNMYHSAVLTNFWLKEAWLWSEKPNPLAALTEIVGVERVIAALRETA